MRNDIEKAKEVSRDIRRGKLRSFSIGGQAMSKANRYDPDIGTYKEIDKLEKFNREIRHDIKNEKVAVIVENIQITEILSAKFLYI